MQGAVVARGGRPRGPPPLLLVLPMRLCFVHLRGRGARMCTCVRARELACGCFFYSSHMALVQSRWPLDPPTCISHPQPALILVHLYTPSPPSDG